MRFSIISAIFVLVFASCRQDTQKDPGSQLHDEFQSIVDSVYNLYPAMKGVAIHVESPELGISWSGSAGWADSATQRKLLPNDPAWIASNTKTYMSASILRLVEMGKLNLSDPISQCIPESIDSLLRSDGYDTDSITILQLSSHTSGISDYVDSKTYLNRTTQDPRHQWSRLEQLELLVSDMDPLGKAGSQFSYSDANHVLLGMVLEEITNKPFYTAMRELLKYEELGLNHTWFLELEKQPEDLSPIVHQFATTFQVDNYTLHPSFDLYGGGGIASTTADVGRFTQYLFDGRLFDKKLTTSLLYTRSETTDGKETKYYMGIGETQFGSYVGFGHGGFWGTTAQYFPKVNSSVCVFLMERDEWPHYSIILEEVVKILEREQKKVSSKTS